MNKKYIIITCICVIISLISGIISNDIIVGGTILLTGLLCAYFASEGKRINYILGLINYLLMGYVSLKNNLYGIVFFYIFIFSPLQVKGFVTWNKNLDDENNVRVREFTLKNSIIITLSCIVGSLLLGYLLTLIPSQRLAFMDASSNCINLCGVILMILRFKESWWLWLINNVIDLSIWVITFVNKGEGSAMMLLVSIGYLLINIYGIIKWNIEAKKGLSNEN
ncbi:MAG: nicotinamide mononucleotide transporter [Bacilli bacterium]|nr:nicotinamide mononucleotide transporter [Bacilli bacterium]